jgi:hypothetical protein
LPPGAFVSSLNLNGVCSFPIFLIVDKVTCKWCHAVEFSTKNMLLQLEQTQGMNRLSLIGFVMRVEQLAHSISTAAISANSIMILVSVVTPDRLRCAEYKRRLPLTQQNQFRKECWMPCVKYILPKFFIPPWGIFSTLTHLASTKPPQNRRTISCVLLVRRPQSRPQSAL